MLKNNELVRYDPIGDLLLLAVVQLVGLRHLMDHSFAAILLLVYFVDDRRYVHFFVAAGESIIGS